MCIRDSIRPGDTLIVKGVCNYDRYENDYVITPFDVLKVDNMMSCKELF